MAVMLGFTTGALGSMNFTDIFEAPVRSQSAVSVIRQHADTLVGLAHAEGSTVSAIMSRSALQRADDEIALVTFQDVTEQLWTEGR